MIGTENLVINLIQFKYLFLAIINNLESYICFSLFEPATNKSDTDDNGRLAVSLHNV